MSDDWFGLLSLVPRQFKRIVAAGMVVLWSAFPHAGTALFMGGVHELATQTTSQLRQILGPMLASSTRRHQMLSLPATHERQCGVVGRTARHSSATSALDEVSC